MAIVWFIQSLSGVSLSESERLRNMFSKEDSQSLKHKTKPKEPIFSKYQLEVEALPLLTEVLWNGDVYFQSL